MIIGINGYAGSGKDTVGMIIQNLTAYPQDDTTSIVEMVKAKYGSDAQWEVMKWAGKLKEVATLLTGIPIEKFEDQEFKKTNLGPEWNRERTVFVEQGVYKTEVVPMTVRDFLQILGTEGLRNGLHENTWVNALMADYTPAWTTNKGEHDPIQELPNWIITDTRFPNEAEAIKKVGGIIIRVERPGVKPINNHPSEVGLDGYDFDYVITNDGTLEDLVDMVREVLRQAKILSTQ